MEIKKFDVKIKIISNAKMKKKYINKLLPKVTEILIYKEVSQLIKIKYKYKNNYISE